MAAVNYHLTDGELQVMYDLATGVVAEQTGSDIVTAQAMLDDFAAKGELIFRGDTEDAYLEAAGNVLIHANRHWLLVDSHLCPAVTA